MIKSTRQQHDGERKRAWSRDGVGSRKFCECARRAKRLSTRYWLPRLRTEKKSMPKVRASSEVRPSRSSWSRRDRDRRARRRWYDRQRHRPPAGPSRSVVKHTMYL